MTALVDLVGWLGQALVEAALVGALAGLVGVLVVLRRRVFFATALTHATFPGGIIAVLVGWNVLVGNALFAVALTLVMLALTTWGRQRAAVASGVVLTGGFALGTTLSGLNPTLPVRVQSFLTGSILTVDLADVVFAGAVLVIAVGVTAALRRQLLYSSFDPTGYRAAGFAPWAVDAVVLTLITATVVALTPAVGAILAIALLAAPPLAAVRAGLHWRGMLVASPLIGAGCAVVGVLVSARWAVAAGPAIVLVATAALGAAWGARQLVDRARVSRTRRVRA